MAKRNAGSRKKTTRRARRPMKARSPKKKVGKKAGARATARRTARRTGSKARKAAPARAVSRPKPPALSRPRRVLPDDVVIPSAPSTLGYAPKASGAETGQEMYHQRKRQHTEGGPRLTAGDIDADWNEAYSSGEEAPGGDMPTPDHDVVEEIGRALGVEYEDAEELKGSEKIEERDRHRWEYDPASAEDYRDRNKKN
jgi:uncharacterized protein DUF6335